MKRAIIVSLFAFLAVLGLGACESRQSGFYVEGASGVGLGN